MKLCKTITILSIVFIQQVCISQVFSPLPTGSFQVGFRSIIEFDFSRPPMEGQQIGRSMGRALQINLWYPLEEIKSGHRLTLNDYLLLAGDQPFFEGSQKEKAQQFLFRYTPQFESYLDSLLALDLSMQAFRGANLPGRSYPVVLLMHEGPAYFSLMAEYLASHGYVVLNFPVFGSTGIPFDNRTNAVESELRDIEFALSIVKKFPAANLNELVLAGFSYGGLAITAHQMRHQMAKALISFDTGITDSWGVGLLEKMPYFDIENLRVPILHFWSPKSSWRHDLQWVQFYKFAPMHTIQIDGLRHFDFTAQGLFRQYFPNWIDQLQGGSSGNYVLEYQLIGQLTLAFLDAVFQPDQSKFAPIIPNDLADYLVQNPKLSPMNEKALIDLYTRKGMKNIKTTYEKRKRMDPKPFSPETFYRFSQWLEIRGNLKESLEWTHYFIQTYPTSAKAYYRLGVIQDQLNHSERSLEAYEQLLEVMPADYDLTRHQRTLYTSRATERIQQLKSKR